MVRRFSYIHDSSSENPYQSSPGGRVGKVFSFALLYLLIGLIVLCLLSPYYPSSIINLLPGEPTGTFLRWINWLFLSRGTTY